MSYLSREEILKADDLKVEDVEVSEWGGTVRVRALSGVDRDSYEVSRLERREDGSYQPNFANGRAKLAARSMIDETGVLMFSELDVIELGKKSAVALDRVATVAARLSGLAEDSDVDAEGNSEAAPSSEPGSSSPAS